MGRKLHSTKFLLLRSVDDNEDICCREKLAPVKLNRYKDDILFYMFYTNVGDVLQLAAAAELYNRDWR